MRRPRIKADGAGYYHCMSRIIERRHVFGNREKQRFLELMVPKPRPECVVRGRFRPRRRVWRYSAPRLTSSLC